VADQSMSVLTTRTHSSLLNATYKLHNQLTAVRPIRRRYIRMT